MYDSLLLLHTRRFRGLSNRYKGDTLRLPPAFAACFSQPQRCGTLTGKRRLVSLI